jgi:hypothetical protein
MKAGHHYGVYTPIQQRTRKKYYILERLGASQLGAAGIEREKRISGMILKEKEKYLNTSFFLVM